MATNVSVGKSSSNGGLGITSILTIIFVVLKVLNVQPVASWSWIWVLSPLWIGFGLFLAALLLFGVGFLVYLGVRAILDSRWATKRRRAREFKRIEQAKERHRIEHRQRAAEQRNRLPIN